MTGPRPDDVVLGGQYTAPLDAAVLGGLEAVKQQFEAGDIETKKAALDRALQYGDKGLDFLAVVLEQELSVEVKGYAKRLRILELLRKSEGTSLEGIDLSGANLYGADLRETNLREANLYGADLRETNLRGAKLIGANLTWANLSQAQVNQNTVLTVIDDRWKTESWWDSLRWDE